MAQGSTGRTRGTIRTGAVLGALVGTLALTACVGPGFLGDGSRADRVINGIPDGWNGERPEEFDSFGSPLAGWIGTEEIGIITWGSSSCPAVARDLRVEGPSELSVTFGPPPSRGPCTADMAPTTHVFAVPDAAVARPIQVTVIYEDWDTEHRIALP